MFVYNAYDTRIKFQGMFHLMHFYRMMREHLKDKEYVATMTTESSGMPAKKPAKGGVAEEETGKTDEKYMETYYSERISTDPNQGRSIWVWWRLSKDDWKNKYYRYRLNMDFHCRFIRDVEIMHEGRKVKTQQGEIEVIMRSDLLCDAHNKWETHWFLKHFHKFFYNRLWRLERDNKRQLLIDEVEFFANTIKKYFGLKTYDTPYDKVEKESFYYTGEKARPYEPAA